MKTIEWINWKDVLIISGIVALFIIIKYNISFYVLGKIFGTYVIPIWIGFMIYVFFIKNKNKEETLQKK